MPNLTGWHSIALAVWVGKIVLCSVKLAKISFTSRSYSFYFQSSNFGEILKCVVEPGNKHSHYAIKRETIGHLPETLVKILNPEMAREEIPLKENGNSAEE